MSYSKRRDRRDNKWFKKSSNKCLWSDGVKTSRSILKQCHLLSNSKMLNLLLLIAVTLMSLQCSLSANAQFESKLDNNLQPNAAGTKKRVLRNFVKIVRGPPETVRHEPGTRTELECMAMGKPAPSVEWLKNGEPISDYDVEANEILPENADTLGRLSSKLIITSSLNGDEYTCVANAGLKQYTATTTVYSINVPEEEEIMALEKLSRLPAKPVITLFYHEIFADLGADIILPCRVYSYTKAQVFWQDTKNNLVYSNSRIRVLPSGDLLITDLRWTDMGNFTCTAKNIYGKESVSTFIYPTKPKVRTGKFSII
ncbi:hypothetical protein K1T71_013983 [Dendrolimus kikuchii]|uniref:Uncharacterized protein n=1 Tax=Dendrolimus kikuchii TaxID=765133 RepID=A0ACC1CGA6_9NEOP|nr:hypothetical protein K1T71_013983 [Dendrolimus kikuchii]